MHDEERLKDKLRAIEALHAGATPAGERNAADRARDRIAARLAELQDEQVIEWQFSLTPWSRRLFVALARRYGLQPYRYKRQRRDTRVVRASERFLTETFIPQYEKMCDVLYEHLDAVTKRVIADVIHGDQSDGEVVETTRQVEAVASVTSPSRK